MSIESDTLQVQAPAKINLYLDILGERENGYHDICSLLVPVSLHDDVCLRRTPEGIHTTMTRTGPGTVGSRFPCAADNLATRAAILLRDETGYAGGARIDIEKHIPVGGGLGGGSADAASVLVGLNRLWGTAVPTERLMEIGSQIGCDVPAQVQGGAVRVEGMGERITPVPPLEGVERADIWVVLVNPGFCVSTPDIYGRYKSSLTSGALPFNSVVCALQEGDVHQLARGLFNGLQGTVFQKYSLIEMCCEHLDGAGALGVALSGSGASVFGLARDEADGLRICDRLGATLGDSVWRKLVRVLPDGVMVAHGPLEA